MTNKYTLQYVEQAKKDLVNIFSYIKYEALMPESAELLLTKFDKAISNLEQFPFSCSVYLLDKKLDDEHRVLTVENYLVFYVVIKNIVEIRRVLHGRRNHNELI